MSNSIAACSADLLLAADSLGDSDSRILAGVFFAQAERNNADGNSEIGELMHSVYRVIAATQDKRRRDRAAAVVAKRERHLVAV